MSKSTLVCLNFKVPMHVRKEFKIYAANHNLTMTELLLQLLDHCFQSNTIDHRSFRRDGG